MRFGCEVDSAKAVVIVRKCGIVDDDSNLTASEIICYFGDIIGPAFRGHEKPSVVRSGLEDHEVRPAGNSRVEACEHTSRGVERSARIRYLHVVARAPEQLLQNPRAGLFPVDGPPSRIAGADCYNPKWICRDAFSQEKQSLRADQECPAQSR